MSDVTRILSQIESGDPSAARQLLPLVYAELRKLAAARLADEKSGQTLQPTALVHEAYIRLVDVQRAQHWDSRGHFFMASAEAMRRILIDRARERQARKRGGHQQRVPLEEAGLLVDAEPGRLLALSEALDGLEAEDPRAAEVVKLHVFAGLSIDEAGEALRISRSSAYRHWTYARAWLRSRYRDGP
jgi:RNA polymerase sigma factor (TIGR02999 family)